MRRQCHAGGDRDHAGALEMEIKGSRKVYTMSQIKLHVMFILLCTLWFCLDTISTVA